jgi:catechol 2,3-dioxygenase-like lactoylglutathione lyase family enzyme
MLQKVAFTMYEVAETARARSFYETTLGLKIGSHDPGGVWTEYDLPGGGCLALFRHPDPSHKSRFGGAAVAFEVADLDALNERLKGAGVHYEADMVHSPVCRMSVIQDPDGNSIILHELKNKNK